MKQRIKRFTLTELYIVIAFYVVLAVLGALLLPALNQAKEKARQADCVSNLSMIGRGVFQYAMSYDDWYPTTTRTSIPKWMNGDSGKSLNLLFRPEYYYHEPLIPDPKVYLCPSKKGISPAPPSGSLRGHVSYNWCEGLIGCNATLSPVACDGTDNHNGSGRFVRGDGSVGVAIGTRSMKWTQAPAFKDFCYDKTYTDYSF